MFVSSAHEQHHKQCTTHCTVESLSHAQLRVHHVRGHALCHALKELSHCVPQLSQPKPCRNTRPNNLCRDREFFVSTKKPWVVSRNRLLPRHALARSVACGVLVTRMHARLSCAPIEYITARVGARLSNALPHALVHPRCTTLP